MLGVAMSPEAELWSLRILIGVVVLGLVFAFAIR